ncbi:MAG: hypothetical protein MAG794_00484 [Gammaproteobacteria bacterium]|nr:hypothetical protein [Gammaproteobacteria bacterium]
MAGSKGDTARIVVFGNEKGGTGKSTTAMHVVALLMERFHRVSVIDLDPRQKTLSRYIENRIVYSDRHNLGLDIPSVHPNVGVPETVGQLEEAIGFHLENSEFLVIDCPGHDTDLSRAAHAYADTLVTPVNDSFVDVDLLGHVDPDNFEVKQLSLYSESVWECRKQRALSGKHGLDWVVIRNRVPAVRSYNKTRVDLALRELEVKIAFRYLEGLGERAIFRELFPQGLTLLDFNVGPRGRSLTMSHVAARHELRNLFHRLNLV